MSSSFTWVTSSVDILNNIANNLIPVESLITGAAYVLGLAFGFKGIYSLKVYGEGKSAMSQSSSMKEPLTYLLIAGVFIYFPTALAMLLQTSFGSSSILQYASVSSSSSGLYSIFGPASSVGRPLTIIIQTIGLYAFVKGWLLISKSAGHGGQQGGVGKGLVHITGGILAMNIVATTQVINNTLYGVS